MTRNSHLKRDIRRRAARTGESYTAARRHLVPGAAPVAPADRPPVRLRIAVARTTLLPDPRSTAQLRESGELVRTLVAQAAREGAALVQFPEGALTCPGKWEMSSSSEAVAEADWTGVDRAVLRGELDQIAALAGALGIWVVVGGIAFDDAAPRPVNSLFVVSDRGRPVGRYDERMLSRTKSLFLYRRGLRPFVFEAGGVRFGCALGMESHYPELFADYEHRDVDCVLLSTHGNAEHPDVFAVEAAGHAAANSIWVGYAGPALTDAAPSGLLGPTGRWVSRCPVGPADTLVIGEIDTGAERFARAWRRTARAETDPLR
jgi:predicted amidohydrolase